MMTKVTRGSVCISCSLVVLPHKQYDNACRARYSYPIDSMLLERPDLGSAFGILNPEGQDYKVRCSIYLWWYYEGYVF
jgi:hypothetical protein